MGRRILIVFASLVLTPQFWIGANAADPAATIAALPRVTREQMIATAKRVAEYKWVCRTANLRAACIPNYDSNWHADQEIVGLPYGWGDMDTPESFNRKLAQGMAAGAHSRHGISMCTAGIDCSGFVALCWGLKSHNYGTRDIRQIAGKPRYNWFTDMQPGDALVKPGDHIVLFAGYNGDGTPNIYEASGSASRVIYHKSPWSRFIGYYPLVYKGITE
jgi:cell wall-associated NlpC family hydrolase